RGRGGTDVTAVALAAALKADVCEIFTDVTGVFSADPRVVPKARKLETVSFDEMLEIAATGGRVLMLRSVEYARRHNVPIHVRSSFTCEPRGGATFFRELADNGINVDMIVQNTSLNNVTDISFSVAKTDLDAAMIA